MLTPMLMATLNLNESLINFWHRLAPPHFLFIGLRSFQSVKGPHCLVYLANPKVGMPIQ
jgi:hypothetical protein